MTNADKYLKDGVDENTIDDLAVEMVRFFDEEFRKIDSKRFTSVVPTFITKFFEQEVKPTLTEDEKVILRNIDDTKYNDLVIKRCKNENLIIYNGGNWAWQIDIFNHLFQFIQPRRRI